jgi:hypothetical protein
VKKSHNGGKGAGGNHAHFCSLIVSCTPNHPKSRVQEASPARKKTFIKTMRNIFLALAFLSALFCFAKRSNKGEISMARPPYLQISYKSSSPAVKIHFLSIPFSNYY